MGKVFSKSTTEISEQEQHWVLVGIGLNKVLAPTLRKAVETELESWHDSLCKPPDEIDKQNFTKYKKKLPPSKNQLRYQNINNNSIHSLASTYDYGVKDALSLARLFVQPFMAHFTGFDETMDMSALLTIIGEAAPFVSSGGAVEAKKVRSDVRNPWAHCNFSEWTVDMFNTSFQAIESLVKKINLPAADEKKVCDELDFWKQTGINGIIFVCGWRLNVVQRPFLIFWQRCTTLSFKNFNIFFLVLHYKYPKQSTIHFTIYTFMCTLAEAEI